MIIYLLILYIILLSPLIKIRDNSLKNFKLNVIQKSKI